MAEMDYIVKSILLFDGILLLFTVIFGLISYFMNRSLKRRMVVCTRMADAWIVDVVKRTHRDTDGHSRTSYHPVYEYEIDGRLLRETSHVGGSRKRYPIGKKERLMVNPHNPSEFYVLGDRTEAAIIRAFRIAAVICGICMVCVPLLVIVMTKA